MDRTNNETEMALQICAQGICKSYGDRTVLNNLTFVLPAGSRTCLTGPSGSGKTTLFRILMGLEHADSGRVSGLKRADDGRVSGLEHADGGRISGPEGLRCAAVFQEDRLFEEISALRNVRLTAAKGTDDAQLRAELGQILPPEALDLPVRKLSGGMKRRVAVARAVLAPSDFLILDEPFTGLDGETKRCTASWILERQGGRTLLFSSHQEEDAKLLKARTIRIPPVF